MSKTACSLALVPLVLLAPLSARAAAPDTRVTAPFRAEHVEILEHLDHLDAATAGLARATPEEQQRKRAFIVKFLKEHILAHAAWEEKVLYPVVDREAGGGKDRFTASMRHEHVIVGRWIGELAKPGLSTEDFTNRAIRVVGLVRAHFELEEEVLLPVLDAKLTPEQFQRDIAAKMAKH